MGTVRVTALPGSAKRLTMPLLLVLLAGMVLLEMSWGALPAVLAAILAMAAG